MHGGIGDIVPLWDGVGLDQFVRLIGVDVVLEAVVDFITFLGPTGIGVFLRQFVAACFVVFAPFNGDGVFFDERVFFPGVALLGCLDKGTRKE